MMNENKQIDELYQAGKSKEAIHQLIALIDQEPKNANNYMQLATYLLDQGSPEQAQELLEKARGLVDNPGDLDYDLAVAYYANGDFDKSLALLKNIPNDDLTLYQKALVYLKMGQTSRALAHALSIKEQGDKVKELLGDIWLALGDLKAAEGSFLAIPEKKRSAKVNFLLGVSCLEADQDRADQFFAKAEKMDPKYYKQAKNQYQSLLKLVSQKQGGQDKK